MSLTHIHAMRVSHADAIDVLRTWQIWRGFVFDPVSGASFRYTSRGVVSFRTAYETSADEMPAEDVSDILTNALP